MSHAYDPKSGEVKTGRASGLSTRTQTCKHRERHTHTHTPTHEYMYAAIYPPLPQFLLSLAVSDRKVLGSMTFKSHLRKAASFLEWLLIARGSPAYLCHWLTFIGQDSGGNERLWFFSTWILLSSAAKGTLGRIILDDLFTAKLQGKNWPFMKRESGWRADILIISLLVEDSTFYWPR